uniref:General transcription factor IIH subunit 3 n=1 Tax=Aceria tosichella TaxID=561515 RepID=A0A6G1SKW5_9ACAR
MSHLLTIVDCSPAPRISQKQFIKWLDSIVTFCNSHLMLDGKNELTIIASSPAVNKIILATDTGIKPASNIISEEGQFEKFAFVTEIIRTGIKDLMEKSQKSITSNTVSTQFAPATTTTTTGPSNHDCLLASALGMALCKINNFKRLPSRILVVSCSMLVTSYAWQYMDLMNSFFAAQKMNVPIDGCVFMKEEAKQRGSILEQGCDLTGGHFLNVPDISGNLEYLLWIFLPSTDARDSLLLPERRRATHRAACFCHRKILDIGYVCSVCLSIFCTYSPICSSCSAHFKLNVPTKVINQLAGLGKSTQANSDQSATTNTNGSSRQANSTSADRSMNNNCVTTNNNSSAT